MFNPLPDYLEDEKRIIYDVDIIDDDTLDSNFYRKLKNRLGSIVIEFNALERLIDECILEMMNDRGEDSRIWILIQDFSFYKKIESLKAIYFEYIRSFDKSDEKINKRIVNIFKSLDELRIRRNLYTHSNWINTINYEYFESKVKFIKKENGYFRVKSKISLLDIENDIKRIEDISEDLYQLHEDIFSQ